MPAYAVAILKETRMNDDIRMYLEKIDQTLAPYEGRFLIHGGPYIWLEGEPTGDLIAIEFPDLKQASHWYNSAAYQEIKPLRTDNSVGTVFLAPGVSPNHRSTEILAKG